MKRTHEKSKFKRFFYGSELETEQKENVVLQIEHIQATEGYKRAYLVEFVNKADYDRTTLEGMLKEKEEFAIDQAEEILNLEAKLAAAEEMLEETQDCREGLRNSLKNAMEENKKIYNALTECKRIFGGLPPEVEEILEKAGAANE